MAGQCPDAIPPRKLGDHSYFAYLQIDEIDAFYASVLASGAEIGKTIRDEPWGMREFGLVTVDGHRIMFAAPRLPRTLKTTWIDFPPGKTNIRLIATISPLRLEVSSTVSGRNSFAETIV